MSDASVFVLTVQAVAGPQNSVPDGRRYDLLVFARGLDEAQAQEVGVDGLAQLGWVDAAVLRSGEITDPDAIPGDLRDAWSRAMRSGCTVIVYEEP